jgi:hypothetical protein
MACRKVLNVSRGDKKAVGAMHRNSQPFLASRKVLKSIRDVMKAGYFFKQFPNPISQVWREWVFIFMVPPYGSNTIL